MQYRGKILDDFQKDAISYIEKGESVIVSAPTGTGKTLIADYAIEKLVSEGERIIYTAPIKALSNQKYREFSEIIGAENVGIMTGDVSINETAPFLIMTTEIYRNILFSQKELAKEIRCVIFDEIHFISDEDRGVVWEESILLKPKNTFIIGLSATIPNIDDLAKWIELISGEKVNVVHHDKRAVPLSHNYYVPYKGVYDMHKYRKLLTGGYMDKKGDENDYLFLFKNLNQEDFPLLYFSFSRRACMEKAVRYSKEVPVKDRDRISEIDSMVKKILSKYERNEDDINAFGLFMKMFHRGVGVHHAGLLPILKLIVEELFENRMLDVIFCTETFAIGINFPVKTVCIDGFRKFDGFEFRNLKNREYFQIGGRAGRRGIDEYGTVITMMRTSDLKYDDFPAWDENKVELLNSNFKVSYNSATHLFEESKEELPFILKNNFAMYLLNKQKIEFAVSRDMFFEDIKKYKEKTCDNLGKNQCPLHYEKVKKELEGKMKLCQNANRFKELKEDYDNLKKKKTKTCSDSCRSECLKHYDLHKNAVSEYLVQKQMYEDFCVRYPEDYFIRKYDTKKIILNDLGYIDLQTNELLARGTTLKDVYIQELLLTEIIYSDFIEKYPAEVVAGVLAGIDYEGKKSDEDIKPSENIEDAILDVYTISRWLKEIEVNLLGETDVRFNSAPCEVVYKVAKGKGIQSIMEECGLSDGDIVNIVRRTVAILSEIKSVVKDRGAEYNKIQKCIRLIDRDEYRALY